MHLNTAVSSLMELVNALYAFSETTDRGAPSRQEPAAREAAERPQAVAVLKEIAGSAGADDFAVRAAHGRGVMGSARPRRRSARGVVAVVRRRGREGRRGRRARADQRQGARADYGVGRGVGSAAARAGAGGFSGSAASRRQGRSARCSSPKDRSSAWSRREDGASVRGCSCCAGWLPGWCSRPPVAATALAGRGSFLPGVHQDHWRPAVHQPDDASSISRRC